MRLFNTLTRTEEDFRPADGKTVRMYSCGLTVYARGHIGNFRTFVCVDVLRRTLKYLLDGPADLYDRAVRLAFVTWLREERKFDDLAALTKAIGEDCVQARALFERLQI